MFYKDNGQPESIVKAIYLKLSVEFSQNVSFCFLLKFIENHKILDPRNTHQKKFETQEIPTRKYSEPTKYPRKNFSDPLRHDGTVARDPQDPRRHETHGI